MLEFSSGSGYAGTFACYMDASNSRTVGYVSTAIGSVVYACSDCIEGFGACNYASYIVLKMVSYDIGFGTESGSCTEPSSTSEATEHISIWNMAVYNVVAWGRRAILHKVL